MNIEKMLKRIEIKEYDGGLFINILSNDYNIIKNTVYDTELASLILQLIKKVEF